MYIIDLFLLVLCVRRFSISLFRLFSMFVSFEFKHLSAFKTDAPKCYIIDLFELQIDVVIEKKRGPDIKREEQSNGSGFILN